MLANPEFNFALIELPSTKKGTHPRATKLILQDIVNPRIIPQVTANRDSTITDSPSVLAPFNC